MIIGGDRTGRPLEVGVVRSDEGVEFVVPAMAARPSSSGQVRAMPRSIQEILDHADELTQRFEEYEPSPDDEVDVAEHLLRRAALARAPDGAPDRRGRRGRTMCVRE